MTEKQNPLREPAPTPKYQIGDRVLVAHWTTDEVREVCPDCGGTKVVKVVLASGEEIEARCQHCSVGFQSRGYVTKNVYVPRVWHGTVGSVRMDTNDKRPVSYMLVETGVGTGSVHYEENLFDNAEDATAAATRKAKRQQELIQKQNEEQRKSRRLKDLRYQERWERHSKALCAAVAELLEHIENVPLVLECPKCTGIVKTLARYLGWIKPKEY
jgi:predicted nucleic acid-binding Zn ribbon protein